MFRFYTTVDAGGSYCDSFSVSHSLMSKKTLWWLSFILHKDWYWGYIIFTGANDKRYLVSYKVVIGIIIIIISKRCATINGIYCQHYVFPRSCPRDFQKFCILGLLCLYPGVCTWSPGLPTGKCSSMTRTHTQCYPLLIVVWNAPTSVDGQYMHGFET